MRKNIETLIASGVTAHQVSKDTTIPRNTAYRIFNGEASLDNISLKNAETLNDYYLKLKAINQPIVDKVFVADNGDVFVRHSNTYQEMSLVNIYELKLKAINLINDNKIEHCKAQTREINGLKSISYYTADSEFIGTSDMHIRENFEPIQDYIFIYRSNEKTSFGCFVESFEKISLLHKEMR